MWKCLGSMTEYGLEKAYSQPLIAYTRQSICSGQAEALSFSFQELNVNEMMPGKCGIVLEFRNQLCSIIAVFYQSIYYSGSL